MYIYRIIITFIPHIFKNNFMINLFEMYVKLFEKLIHCDIINIINLLKLNFREEIIEQ